MADEHSQGSQPPAPQPVPAASPGAVPVWYAPPKRRSWLSRVLLSVVVVVFLLSLCMNFYLMALLAMQMDTFETKTLRPGNEQQVVAVYALEGIIDNRAADAFQKFVETMLGDGNVKAVVLRVNSPGGGVTASDQIAEQVKRIQAGGKKLVVSMSSLAASGGYYISAPADEIIAEPTTITGSIGVIMSWLVVKGTLEKVGVQSVVMKSSDAHPWKDEISIFDEPTARQRQHLQHVLDSMQARFEQVVRDGRGDRLKPRKIAATQPAGRDEIEPFNGKIYLAQEALALGLVDRIGYLGMAIDRAQSLAGLAQPKVVRYERHRSFLDRLLESKAPTLGLDMELLQRFQTPQFEMIWKAE